MRAERRHRPLPAEPATLLTEGRLGEAVRVLSRSHGLSRRDARAWINTHLADDALLRAQLETRRQERVRRIVLWVVLIDAVIVAAFIYYFLYMRR